MSIPDYVMLFRSSCECCAVFYGASYDLSSGSHSGSNRDDAPPELPWSKSRKRDVIIIIITIVISRQRSIRTLGKDETTVNICLPAAIFLKRQRKFDLIKNYYNGYHNSTKYTF